MFKLRSSQGCRELNKLLYRHIIIILASLVGLGLGIALMGTYYLSINLLDSQAMQHAQVAVNTLNKARQLYSGNVVDRVKSINGVSITPEYHFLNGGIPNPATYTIELGDHLSDPSRGMLFRLYSDYPFPNRQVTGGPQDKFEREALSYLKVHPKASFYRKEQLGNYLTFRYTEAVRMEPSCVSCHNKLPNSPKKDWKVGQVRGVVEVTQPLNNIKLIAQDGLKVIYIVLAIMIVLAIVGLILVVGRLHTINQELELKVLARTAALNRLATIDGLTQLANRRQFDQHLAQEWQRARRQQQPLSLIMCDIDYFKNYNDTYGHQAGDACLCAVAHVLQSSIKRSGELAARYGGEEFALILPNVNSIEATKCANLIRDRIHQLKISHKVSLNHMYVTMSLGVATTIPSSINSEKQLIEASDQALYEAKKQGRDQLVVWNNLET